MSSAIDDAIISFEDITKSDDMADATMVVLESPEQPVHIETRDTMTAVSPSPIFELNRNLAKARRENEHLTADIKNLKSVLIARAASMTITATQYEKLALEHARTRRALEHQLTLVNNYKVLAELDVAWLNDNRINTTLFEAGLHVNAPFHRYTQRSNNAPTYKPHAKKTNKQVEEYVEPTPENGNTPWDNEEKMAKDFDRIEEVVEWEVVE